jgi:signal transduction histidine kinase
MSLVSRRQIKKQPAKVLLDHERLLTLINNIADGFLALDESMKIVLFNGVALNLLDTNSLDGIAISKAFNLCDTNGRKQDLAQLIDKSGGTFDSRDYKIRYHDGSLASIYISVSQVRGTYRNHRAGYVVILTPVAIAEGNISNALMLAERGNLPDNFKQSLAAAHDQTIFLSNLINDLSMLSRAERGELSMEVEAFDAGAMVKSLIHDYQPQAKIKNLHFSAKIQPDVREIQSSPLYVREMLQNFVTNAIKYTDKGGVGITAAKKNGGVEFTIADTGIGVSQNEQSKLFNKFFRADDWRVRKVNGTGLGLYVTAKLAKLLNATIDVESKINHGSTFKLYVPNLPKPKSQNES